MIKFDTCKELSDKLIDIQDKIKKMKKEWEKRMILLFQKYSVGLKKFYFFLSEIDCYCAGAKLSIQNGYNRPEVEDSNKSS